MNISIPFLCKHYIQLAYEDMCKLVSSDADKVRKFYPVWDEIAKDDVDLEATLEQFIEHELHADAKDFVITTYVLEVFAKWMIKENYMQRQSYIDAVAKYRRVSPCK